MASKIRSGIGYDVHLFTQGRRLVLGGVDIPFDKGLDGWSDADVLTHSIIDALLGAASMGDIGSHFPSGKPEYRGIASLELLKKVKNMLDEKGWKIVNIDATVVAEQPRLRNYIDQIREKLSETLEIEFDSISVKASSNNGLGFIGRGEGIAALAIALVEGEK